MQQHHIDIEIRPDGEVKVHIEGAKGKQCIKYQELFKQIVGEVKEEQLTHEYYEPDPRVMVDIENQQHIHH
ncbi:MAG: DUF2997 domain-containing protein [Candidatus Sumerlaeia bacterium]